MGVDAGDLHAERGWTVVTELLPLVIEAAINEQAPKAENSAVPYTPDECAAEAIACADAGATIVHFHARDSDTGALLHPGTEVYAEAMRIIRRERPELLVYPTYGMAADPAQRFEHVEKLADDPDVALQIMTLDPGPVDMTRFDAERAAIGDAFPFDVSHDHCRYLLELCRSRGVRPTFVVRELGHVRTVVAYHRMGWVDGPILMRISLRDDALWGAPPSPRGLDAYLDVVPDDVPIRWMTYTYGPSHWPLALHAIASGGHVRTGLGDNPVEPDGRRLTNAEKVCMAVEAASIAGRAVATASETRDQIGATRLRGGGAAYDRGTVRSPAEVPMTAIRTNWTLAEVRELFDVPLLELVRRAGDVHREFHDPTEVQVCQLVSIKTGGCPEDCGYCSQSSHHEGRVKPEPLMGVDEVVRIARRAKAQGVTRLCMGAAWREVKDNAQFDRVLDMVRGVNAEGLEVCATLGMLTAEQAAKLDDAGLYAYNHNLDTSAEFYDSVITTRTYQDRLDTIENVRTTEVTVCAGGIIGLGESIEDRAALLHTLATLDPHPESVPVNVLSKVEGTPLGDQPDVPIQDTVRMVAIARLLMPSTVVRLSAGRHRMSASDQALCFLAGANSIFSSERNIMLTEAVPCADHASDRALLASLGLHPRPRAHAVGAVLSAPSVGATTST